MIGTTGIRSEYAQAARITMFSHSLKIVYPIPIGMAMSATLRAAVVCAGQPDPASSSATKSALIAIRMSPPVQCRAAKTISPAVPSNQIV